MMIRIRKPEFVDTIIDSILKQHHEGNEITVDALFALMEKHTSVSPQEMDNWFKWVNDEDKQDSRGEDK